MPGQAGRPTVNHRRETMGKQDDITHQRPRLLRAITKTQCWPRGRCFLMRSTTSCITLLKIKRLHSNACVPCGAVHAGGSEAWWDSSYGPVVSCERQNDGCSTRWRTTWTSPSKTAAGKGTYGLGWRCLGTRTHIYFQTLYLLSGDENVVVMQIRRRMCKWQA